VRFKVKRTIEQYRLLEYGERILVGVSGGVDSIALLSILKSLATDYHWELHVAHVEHGFRGEDSLADAEFVRNFSEMIEVPFHLGQPRVKQYAEEKKLSKQVAARELRYRFFAETAKEIEANKLVLAHHADDQAETVLMRILRGTSVSGLAGIPLRRQENGFEIVRPLLFVWRNEIEDFCKQENLSYRTDLSNALTDYLRNKIRLQLIPLLEEAYNESVKRALVQLGQIAGDEDALLDQMAKERLNQIMVAQSNDVITLDTEQLLTAPLALQRRVIKLILYYLCGHTNEWEAKHIEQVLAVSGHTRPSVEIHLPNEMTAWREYRLIHIGRKRKPNADSEVSATKLFIPDWPSDWADSYLAFEIPEFGLRGSMELSETSIIPVNPWEAVFDYNLVRGKQFHIRARFPGDSMRPVGMNGSKKLKEIFIDSRIPVASRDRWPIWILDEQIAWVTGIRRGQVATVGTNTRQILRIRIEQILFNGEMNSYRG
jgi:tRNA(Ile)-lysidine synthase